MLLFYIILFSSLGSVGAILGASVFLLIKEERQKKIIYHFVSYATGTLLGAALLGLIPHSIEHLGGEKALKTVLLGILVFFVLEKIVLWRHCHKEHCHAHHAAGPMILVGDALHNFVDGVMIAGAFLISIPMGIATSFSVIAHELPQEVGDFAILLHSGYSRKRAFVLNIISGLSAILGSVLAFFILKQTKNFVPYVMAFSAASFLYISLVDLSPGLHNHKGFKKSLAQFVFIVLGILTIAFFVHEH